MATLCCVEGCNKESAHETPALKGDLPLKPNVANNVPRSFGLCLDHYMSESSTPSHPQPHGEYGRMGRRDSNASVEDIGLDDNGNADDDNMAAGWDENGAKEDAGGLRRSNRTFKRPRKYFEDEMIVEDEAFIFDGKAIERMFKNQQQQQKPGGQISKEKEKEKEREARGDSSASKRVEKPRVENTPNKKQAIEKGKVPGEKRTSPGDTKNKDKDKKLKDKPKEKDKPEKRRRGRDGATPSTTLKKCWYVDCHKADRSLKLLRPFLVPTCKSHAIRVESRLCDAILNNTIQLKEGNNVKDNICGCCTGLYGREVLRCSNENCAFSFCSKCATTLGAKNGNPGNSPKWVCWVCESSRIKNKLKERSRYIATLRQGIAQNGGAAPKTRRQDKTDSQFLQYMEEDPTAAARKNSLRQVRQKIMKVPDPMELGYYYTSPVPQPPPPAIPNRNPLLDKLLESLISSVKFFANGENFTLASAELMSKVNGVFELARLMKLTRVKESDHEHVWAQVKDYSEILLKNIQHAEQLLKLQNEVNMYEAIPGNLAESTLAKHNEMRQSVDMLRAKCISVCDSTVTAIEDIRKKVDLVNHDYEVATYHRVNRETKIGTDIRGLEEDIALSATEASAWRVQEAELVERLVKVRANIARCEKQQEESTQRMADLKGELVQTRYQLRNMELNVAKVESNYTSETKAFELLAKLVEEAYWLHEYYANKKNQDKEYMLTLHNRTEQRQASANRRKTLAVYHNDCLEHTVAESNLDKPERLRVVISTLKEIKANMPHLIDINSSPPEVDNRYLMCVHDSTYIRRLQAASTAGDTPLSPSFASKRDTVDKTNAPDFSDTPLSANSLSAAKHAAGAVVEAVDNVMRGKYAQAFCAVRPPGHHVGKHGRTKGAPSQGYCLLNNVAIGAKYALFSGGYERVAVVDFDVHHGNGTQEILQGDEGFLFISTHVYEDKTFFPGTGRDLADKENREVEKDEKERDKEKENKEKETKEKEGEQMQLDQPQPQTQTPTQPQTPSQPQTQPQITPPPPTQQPRKRRKKEELAVAIASAASAAAAAQDVHNVLNVGLRRPVTAAAYIHAIKTRVIPRLEQFKPQFIVLSAGFDGHRDDPSNGMKLSEEDYFTITKLIMRVAKKHCGGKIVSVLEGGYQLERQVLKKCVQAHLRALLTDDDYVSPSAPSDTFPFVGTTTTTSSSSSSSDLPSYATAPSSSYSRNANPFNSFPSNFPTTSNNDALPPLLPPRSSTSTNITKITRNLPLESNNTSTSPITIIDDPEQSNAKQAPPKKGSIESILL